MPVARLREAGVPVCVGSDSNTLLDPLAELRELEHVARRTARRRNVLVADGDRGPAPYLLSCGWEHGARALGLPAPVIEADAPADLIAIDLDHAEIAGVADEHLAAAIVMAGSAALVTRTWVAGGSHGATVPRGSVRMSSGVRPRRRRFGVRPQA